jgi:integrase
MPKLSQQFCERAKPKPDGSEAVYFDGATKGFTFRVGPNYKRFELRVSRRDGDKRSIVRHKIGTFPGMSAADARKAAQRILGRDDPAAVPSRGPTLAQAWARYKAELEARPASPNTISNYGLSFRQVADLHHVSLRALTNDPLLVADAHARITRAGKPVGANAMVRFVRAVYRHAGKYSDLPEKLPTRAVAWNREKRRETAVGVADLPAWEKERLALTNPIQRELALFLLLSGLRRRDACSARWDEIDMKRLVLHRPRPKGREGNKPAFDLPLSRAMLRCLWRVRRAGRMLHEEQAKEWIFPADSASGHISEIKSQKLSHHGHDLRRSYATLATEAGIPEENVARLLNHARGKNMTRTYVIDSPMLAFLRDCQERISRRIVRGLRS